MGLEEDVGRLAERLDRIEARLGELERASTPVTPPPPGVQPPPPTGHAVLLPPPGVQPPPAARPAAGSRRGPAQRLEVGSSEALLKWAGLVLVVLAAAFLVSTAIGRGWIGPELQLAGATLAGLALIAGGFRLAPVSRPWALALAAGGAVVLPICAAASDAGLDLLSNPQALAALAAVTVGLVEVARRLAMQAVAVVAALAAATLPLWIVADQDLPVLTVSAWLAAVAIGFTGVGLVRRWSWCRLGAVGSGGLVLLAVAEQAGDRQLDSPDRLFAYGVVAAVVAAAWAGPALAHRWGQAEGPLLAIDLRSVVGLPLWSWVLIGAIARFERQEALAVAGLAIAAGFVVVAATAGWTNLLDRRLLAAHLLGAGALVSVALAVLTGGPSLLVALAAQAVATAVLAERLGDVLLAIQAAAVGAIAVIWAGTAIAGAMLEPIGVGQHLADLAVVAAVVAGALLCRRSGVETLWPLLAVLAWAGSLAWLGSALIHGPQGQVVVSGAWAAAAAGAIAVGVARDRPLAWRLGMATLAVALAKLLTVDLAAIDTLWRVGLFFVVGAGLLRLGYLLPKLSAPADRD